MLKKIRDNMFFIGVIIFSLTLFVEHLLTGETNLTCFFKGFACGLELVGIVVIFKNKKSNVIS